MWRPPLAAALLVSLAVGALASTPYDGEDAQGHAAFRRLLSPLEISLTYVSFGRQVESDPVFEGIPAEEMRNARQAMVEGARALAAAPPDQELAQEKAADARAALIYPVLTRYLETSAEASRGESALTAFESALSSRLLEQWGEARPAGSPAPNPRHIRALLRAEANAYINNPPSPAQNPLDRDAAVSSLRANLAAALAGTQGEALDRLYSAARMSQQPAPGADTPVDPRMSAVNDRVAMLRRAMPAPGYSDMERTVLAAVLSDQALADVAAGRSTLDLHAEARDAANLAMADADHAEVQTALRGKTLYRSGAMDALRAAVPAAELARYVCASVDRRAPALRGGTGSAMDDLQASADAPVTTVAYPGVADRCRGSAVTTPSSRSMELVGPQKGLKTNPVPGTGTEKDKKGGGVLGALKSGLPYIIGGALGGLVVAAAIGLGPVGLLLGALAGGGFGFGLSLLFGKK